ncbi:MAG: zinc ribbon domain-containing protein [Chitinivibrionales bacterium]|nr:zinc ribbon domain-containing protein [Chitinivibrionales bacterium]MBD3396455.1 zinc ribbon domain-containing protein [Chitinivibrionales bacterium]
MPIYEFYCPKCNTIYSFFSRGVNTEKTPLCPSCKKDTLRRRVSLFAVTGKAEEKGDDLDNLPIDESKMMGAMESLAGEAENLNEDDPRQAAKLMRKLSDMTGLRYQDNIEEALSRMEAGEDPEAIEESMGDALEGDEMPFVLDGKKGSVAKKRPPHRDERLYEM